MDATKRTLFNRRALLALAGAALALPAQAACAAPRVLFVCRFGSVKSPFARELTRQRAAERGLAVEVASRGLTPDDHADAGFLRRAAAQGLDLARQPLTQFRPADTSTADVVVSFEPLSESGLAGARDWSDTPSMMSRYDEASAAIESRVDALLDELARRAC